MRITPAILLNGFLVALVGFISIGCKSTVKSASAPFAAVRIKGHTAEQIRGATAVVFQQDGYTAVDVHSAEMIFEKQGSRWDRIVYGNWVDEEPVRVRVRPSVVPVSGGVFELRCQAFRVLHKGEPGFEEEVRLKNSKPFRALLDKVSAKLASQPGQ